MFVCVRVDVFECVDLYVCLDVFGRVYVCVCVDVFVCVCVCMYVCVCKCCRQKSRRKLAETKRKWRDVNEFILRKEKSQLRGHRITPFTSLLVLLPPSGLV